MTRKELEHKIIKNRVELRKSNNPERKRELINENHELMKALDKWGR